jgi:hypothetical protein
MERGVRKRIFELIAETPPSPLERARERPKLK